MRRGGGGGDSGPVVVVVVDVDVVVGVACRPDGGRVEGGLMSVCGFFFFSLIFLVF